MDPKIAAAITAAVFEYIQCEEMFQAPGDIPKKTWSSSGRGEIMQSAASLRSRSAARWSDFGRPGMRIKGLD